MQRDGQFQRRGGEKSALVRAARPNPLPKRGAGDRLSSLTSLAAHSAVGAQGTVSRSEHFCCARQGDGASEQSLSPPCEGGDRGGRMKSGGRAIRLFTPVSARFPPLAKGGLGGVVPAEHWPDTRFESGCTHGGHPPKGRVRRFGRRFRLCPVHPP